MPETKGLNVRLEAGHRLIIEVDLTRSGEVSSTGKSIIVAKTGGWLDLSSLGLPNVAVNANVIQRKP